MQKNRNSGGAVTYIYRSLFFRKITLVTRASGVNFISTPRVTHAFFILFSFSHLHTQSKTQCGTLKLYFPASAFVPGVAKKKVTLS